MSNARERAEKLAIEVTGSCHCDEAYSCRDLTDPNCSWCNAGKYFADQLTPLLEEIEAARKMRDEFYSHFVGIDYPPEHPGYKFTQMALRYDAIRKRNESEEKK